MEKFKGTKDTWIVEKFTEPLNEMMNANFGVYAQDGAKTPICKFPKSIGNPQTSILIERQTADANLVAAAPEMFKRLSEVIQAMDSKVRLENDDELYFRIVKTLDEAVQGK